MRQTIYKTDSKGKLRFLTYWIDGDTLIQEAGIVGTDSPTVNRKQCYPKNTGKANATTGAQQAQKELEAKVAKKLKTEYFRTAEEAKNQKVILPMLAKKYEDEKHKIDGYSAQHNTFMQRKLDGFRCVAIVENETVTLMSRSNREIENMDHIKTQLAALANGIYDGELYKHGLTFQEISRLIKKYRPGESETIEYHMYDMQSSDSFYVRHFALNRNFVDAIKAGSDIPNLVLVPTTKVLSQNNVEILRSVYVDEGYEGAMVRWGNAPYKTNGRSDHLLKLKIMEDLALVIQDIVPNEADPTQGTPIVHLEDGTVVRCNVKGSHEERRHLLSHKQEYIGQKAEIRFFGYTDDGSLRHPTYYGIRHDK